ncbi:MAG: hypothetical protein JWN43_30 [Gammaproteobacteria bacterium]|nr:hypothetical protein [Gammaproteobacteria bacterium]
MTHRRAPHADERPGSIDLRFIAGLIGMTDFNVSDQLALDHDQALSSHHDGAGAMAGRKSPPPKARLLRHESRLLPNAVLDPRGRYGAACRARFDGRSLREAADYVRDCDAGFGRAPPDDFRGLFVTHTGTIGAKQAFLAALALEIGRKDLQLVVACCEMALGDTVADGAEGVLRRPLTLPLAVCWLCYRGRRLQIVEPQQASLQTLKPVTEVAVRPEDLAAERVRLYRTFAADWCLALEVSPADFARLRSSQLRLSAGTSVFEDLLGHALPCNYAPTL